MEQVLTTVILVSGIASSSGSALAISLPLPPSSSRLQVYVQHLALEPVVGGMTTTASPPVLLRPEEPVRGAGSGSDTGDTKP